MAGEALFVTHNEPLMQTAGLVGLHVGARLLGNVGKLELMTCRAGLDSDEEEARGMPAVPQPVSPVRMPAMSRPSADAPPSLAAQAQQTEGMLRALEVVRSKGEPCLV